MKIIKIELTKKERLELEKICRSFSDYRSERALAVLHCANGKKATHIAAMLNKTIQTICAWLKAYQKNGIDGLNRKYSPGRPSIRQEKLIPLLDSYLSKSPRDYGWGENVWGTKVIIAQFMRDTGVSLSQSTVERALRDAGYSFKRAKKGVPMNAPSKEEKLKRVKSIAQEISNLKANEDVEVMFLDESHFSTEPYVTRGWHKRGKPFFPTDSNKKRRVHNIWGIRSGKRFFLLEEFE
jgi:transposase